MADSNKSNTLLHEGEPARAHEIQKEENNGVGGFRMKILPSLALIASHHYVYELYALDSKLNLPDNAARIDIMKASDRHILAASAWFGLFHQ
jgi:phosphatidylethanolamine-binding protein (PEBP) family uncharacterized protein